METIGTRVYTLRQERGWTLRELADRAHTSKGYLSTLEHNGVDPTLSTLTRLARAFVIPLSVLLTGLGEDTDETPPLPFE